MEKRCRKSPNQSSVKKPHSKPRRSSGKWLQLLLFLCFPDPAVNKASKRIIGICKQKTANFSKTGIHLPNNLGNWISWSRLVRDFRCWTAACQFGIRPRASQATCNTVGDSETWSDTIVILDPPWSMEHLQKNARNLPPHSWFYIGCLLFNVRLPILELRGKGSSLCLFRPVEEWRDSETWEIWKSKAVVICIDS